MSLLRRYNYASGAPMEEKIGYSRAVKVGQFVFVGGTTSTSSEGVVEGEADAYGQTKIVFDKIEAALIKAGAKLSEVYRVRIYCTDMGKAQEIMTAFSEYFKDIRPTTILVEVTALARPAHLVEVEAEAVIGSYLIRQE